jgi:hypothetical protein
MPRNNWVDQLARALREKQAGVAEFVPPVPAGQRGGVGASNEFRAGEGFQ